MNADSPPEVHTAGEGTAAGGPDTALSRTQGDENTWLKKRCFTYGTAVALSAEDDTGGGQERRRARVPTKPSAAPPQLSRCPSRLAVPAKGWYRLSSSTEYSAALTTAHTEIQQSHAPTRKSANHELTNQPPSGMAGRKSGRLREKGPTTYTARGEVFRGGKRVNEYKR